MPHARGVHLVAWLEAGARPTEREIWSHRRSAVRVREVAVHVHETHFFFVFLLYLVN
jgi:hypothetical protein